MSGRMRSRSKGGSPAGMSVHATCPIAAGRGTLGGMDIAPKLQEMLRWNWWANAQVLAVLVGAGGEPKPALAAFQHIYETEIVWLRRIDADQRPMLTLWGQASLDFVQEWVVEARERSANLVAALENPAEADRMYTYQNSQGMEFTNALGDTLLHMLMHSSQYRGEAAGILNAKDLRVPDLDLIFWQRLGRPDIS